MSCAKVKAPEVGEHLRSSLRNSLYYLAIEWSLNILDVRCTHWLSNLLQSQSTQRQEIASLLLDHGAEVEVWLLQIHNRFTIDSRLSYFFRPLLWLGWFQDVSSEHHIDSIFSLNPAAELPFTVQQIYHYQKSTCRNWFLPDCVTPMYNRYEDMINCVYMKK